jgi:SAM-dependent methyltransferase
MFDKNFPLFLNISMPKHFKTLASDPHQYDSDRLNWANEGSEKNYVRRLFLENLDPYLDNVKSMHVLDVGCGLGWLTNEIQTKGGNVIGIDSSKKNLQKAQRFYSDCNFLHKDFFEYNPKEKFDRVFVIMVFEHIIELNKAYEKLSRLLKENGSLIIITGDKDRLARPRDSYKVSARALNDQEVVTKTDYGKRMGILYDIHRENNKYIEGAHGSGLELDVYQPIITPLWLINEQSRYQEFKDKPIFHLYQFSNKKKTKP